RRWGRASADLLHERQQIADSPMVCDLAVPHAHHVNGFEMNVAMSRRNSEEWAIVGAVIGFVSSHTIAIRELPMNLRMKVRKRRANVGVELADAGLVGSGSRLGGVIHEIVRKQLFENVKVPSALHLFGITAHNCFRSVRC